MAFRKFRGRKRRFTRFKTRSKLRGRKRARRATVTNRTSVKTGLGFPKRMMMTHRYVENSIQLSSAVSLGSYSFCCNGMTDPNLSGGGHKPYYFNQMAALYDHYTVIGAKITVRITPQAATVTIPMIAGVFLNDDTTVTASTTIDTLCENSKVHWKSSRNVQDGSSLTFGLKWSAKKTFGGSILANNSLQGTTTANPTEQSCFTVFLQALNQATSLIAYLSVKIEYIAIWEELKDISQST